MSTVIFNSNCQEQSFVLLPDNVLGMRLVTWVSEDEEPPASAYPTVAAGTLVAPSAVAFPPIPGVVFPEVIHVAYRAGYGDRFAAQGIVDVQPPELGPTFPSQVSQVDGFGNELAGVRAYAQVPSQIAREQAGLHGSVDH